MLTASYSELYLPYSFSRKEHWIIDGKIVVDPITIEYIELQKQLPAKKYVFGCNQWDSCWFAGMQGLLDIAEGILIEIFAYFLPPWGLKFVIKNNVQSTSGDWGVITGPAPFSWGGAWLVIPKKARNIQGAKDFIKFLTHDNESLYNWYLQSGDFVNTKKINQYQYFNVGDKFLKGQSPFGVFYQSAPLVNGKLFQSNDAIIQSFFQRSYRSLCFWKAFSR